MTSSQKLETLARARALSAKKLVEAIRQHPEGITGHDLQEKGISLWGLPLLRELRLIRGKQVKEPERGPKAYRWLWVPQPPEKYLQDQKCLPGKRCRA